MGELVLKLEARCLVGQRMFHLRTLVSGLGRSPRRIFGSGCMCTTVMQGLRLRQGLGLGAREPFVVLLWLMLTQHPALGWRCILAGMRERPAAGICVYTSLPIVESSQMTPRGNFIGHHWWLYAEVLKDKCLKSPHPLQHPSPDWQEIAQVYLLPQSGS